MKLILGEDGSRRAREFECRDTLRSFVSLFRVDPGSRPGRRRKAVHCAKH